MCRADASRPSQNGPTTGGDRRTHCSMPAASDPLDALRRTRPFRGGGHCCRPLTAVDQNLVNRISTVPCGHCDAEHALTSALECPKALILQPISARRAAAECVVFGASLCADQSTRFFDRPGRRVRAGAITDSRRRRPRGPAAEIAAARDSTGAAAANTGSVVPSGTTGRHCAVRTRRTWRRGIRPCVRRSDS